MIKICSLAVQIDLLIQEDKDSLASMAIYAEDEPTAQRELHGRLIDATRTFNALYNGDYGSENRIEMKVASQMQKRLHSLRANVSISSKEDALHADVL